MLSTHRTNIILLNPFSEAFHMKKMPLIAPQLGHWLSATLRIVLETYGTIIDLLVLRWLPTPTLGEYKLLDSRYPRELILLLL